MQTEVTKKLFTVDEYYRMADAGILTEDDRVELIDGEIIEMSPVGNRRRACVHRALPRYAAAGVAEVWIEDLKNDLFLVFRNPADKAFKTSSVLHRGDSISPLAFPKVTFKVNDLLG